MNKLPGVRKLALTGEMIYLIFGLRVMSDVRLPALTIEHNLKHSVDVHIRMNTQEEIGQAYRDKPFEFIVHDNGVWFYCPQAGLFKVTGGKDIEIIPDNPSDEDLLRIYILGSMMGICLLQRRILPLHGSAVEIGGQAYALIGESGAGKSTLASTMIQQGYKLISDDVIAVTCINDKPMVAPSYPQQKLWQESIDQLGLDSASYRSIYGRETKFNVPVKQHFTDRPLPLVGIFELDRGEASEPRLVRAPKLEKLHLLFKHTYRQFMVPRLNLMDWHFSITSQLASKVDMYQLIRPNEGYSAPMMAELVLETLHKEKETV